MCRYAATYKLHYACFGCRKMFRQPPLYELAVDPQPTTVTGRVVPCPQCGERMHDLGLDFKAPKQRDLEQWEKVKLLHDHGIRFQSCGCSGPGPRPARLRDVPAFLETILPQSKGQRLLRRLAGSPPAYRPGRMPPAVSAGEHPLGASIAELWRGLYYTGRGAAELRKKKAQSRKSARQRSR